MPLTTDQHLNTANKLFFKAMTAGYLNYDPIYPRIFSIQQTDRRDSRFDLLSGGEGLKQVGEYAEYPETNPSEVGYKTISQKSYKNKISFSILSWKTSIPNLISLAKNSGERANIIRDRAAAAVFKNANISTHGYGINIDGTAYPLCGTAQAIGNTGKTQSNKITAALSKTALREMKNKLFLQKDMDDVLMTRLGRKLIVPTALADKAEEEVFSKASTDDNKNAGVKNTNQGLEIIEWAQLETPDPLFNKDPNNDTQSELDDNYFMLANMIDNPLVFLNLLTLESRTGRGTNGSYDFYIDSIFDAQAVNYLGVIGSNGTT